MNKDRVGGLIFLAFSLAYAYSATLIPSLPGEELESLTPRTFPYALSIFGVIFSLLLIVRANVVPSHTSFSLWRSYDWKLTASLLVLMTAYGLLLPILGFLIATLFFLISGYFLMGERRPKVLFLASVPLVIVFWFLLAKVLGVFLETGSLWE